MENGKWKTWIARWQLSICLLTFAIFHVAIAGCSGNAKKPTSQPSSIRDRQNAAMDDPFSYSPYSEKNDISGGDIDDWDRDGMKKDLDNVLNP